MSLGQRWFKLQVLDSGEITLWHNNEYYCYNNQVLGQVESNGDLSIIY